MKATQSPSEHWEQTMYFTALRVLAIQDPEYGLIYAIPNGGLRNQIVGKKLKDEGVKPGVPDIFIPVARIPYHGAYIEMKRNVKNPKLSPSQKKFIYRLREQGYFVAVCAGHIEALQKTVEYIKL